MTNIYISLSTFAEFGKIPLEILNRNKFNLSFNKTNKRILTKDLIKYAADADGIIAGVEKYDQEVIDCLPKLKCISRVGVGIDNIDLNYVKKKKIEIRNTPDEVILPVSELTLSMMLSLLRKTFEQTQILKEGKWKKLGSNNLSDKKVGIIGTGRIGKNISETLMYLGCNVMPCDLFPDLDWAKKNNLEYHSFEKILSECDIISLHASSESHRCLINIEQVKKMKEGVIVINTSRGSLIDEEALVYGMNNKIIKGLGLDVFSNEPYQGKLTNFDNIILTPHVATLTAESRLKMEIKAVENLVEFFRKKI